MNTELRWLDAVTSEDDESLGCNTPDGLTELFA